MTDVLPSRCSAPADALGCRPVRSPAELTQHHRIRHTVFVLEQGLFEPDDLDLHDDDPATVHALGLVDEVPAGTVRLYPLAGTLWKGDRLAVLRGHRHTGIGGPLVRFAVATAAQRGGTRMDATVQAPNTDFFLGLGWSTVGDPAEHLGALHQSMTIALG